MASPNTVMMIDPVRDGSPLQLIDDAGKLAAACLNA